MAKRRFSLAQQIEEVERELDQRRKVYPNLIRRKMMTNAIAEYHVDRMKAVLVTLQWLQAHQREVRAAARGDVPRETISNVKSET